MTAAESNYIYYLLVEKLGYGDEYFDYLELWRLLLRREFIFINSMDENRAIDGIDLRREYLSSHPGNGLMIDAEDPCSVLEMMVALSLRIEYDIMGEIGKECPYRWMNIMISNLHLDDFKDERIYSGWKSDANYILDRWMLKDYSANGEGSAFPLEKYDKNQKKMVIWSQMSEYLNENFS